MDELLEPEVLVLRDYQEWARHRMFEAMQAGNPRVCLVMPTGSGKRLWAVWLAKFCIENNRRMLFLTNRRLLVEQMFNDARKYGVDHGVIMAQTEPRNLASPILIASLQTLESRYFGAGLGALAGVGIPEFDILAIDEGHCDTDRYKEFQHNVHEAWRKDGSIRASRPMKVVLLTATPVGPDGRSLVSEYADIVVEGCKNSELIDRHLLLPTWVIAPSGPDVKGVDFKDGEYNQEQLGRRLKECTLFGDVFNEWAPFADRKTVCFVPSVAYGRDIVRQFNQRLGGGKAWLIEANTSRKERERIFQMVRNGEAQVLVSCEVLTTGFDMEELSCMIDLQPNKQFRNWWQKVGRIKRTCEGQTEAVLIDMAGNLWEFIHPDDDPIWPVGEETTQDCINKRRDLGEHHPITCPNPACKTGYTPITTPPKCPKCGMEIKSGKPMKPVRMGNGKLEFVSFEKKKKHQKSEEERRLDKWKGLLFGALKKGWTFKQVAKFYKDAAKESPKRGWPGVWEFGSENWSSKVKDHMDPKTIMRQCMPIIGRLRAEAFNNALEQDS